MIESSYPYGEQFQLRLLALLVKRPEKARAIVEAQFFTSPVLVDIARIVQATYRRHSDSSLNPTTLGELVRESLGQKETEYWPTYKKCIKKIFRMKLHDEPVLMEQAKAFNKEMRYRDALVKAERDITAGHYERVHKTIEEARIALADSGESKAAIDLPVYHFHRLLATEFDSDQDSLIGTIVPRSGAILSYGLPKGLKSWFSTGVALDAAIGDGQALGYFSVPTPIRVLLVQVEDSAGRTKSRLQRLWEARPFGRHPHPGNLQIVTRCPLNLLDPAWIARLEAVIAKQKTELVIFDVFRRVFRGNVNSPEETAAFLEVVDGLRDKYGVAVWIVHHSRKSESDMMTRALGSINLTAWPDVLLYFKNKKVLDHVTTCNLEMETKDHAVENEFRVVLDDEGEPMLWVEEAKPAQDKLHQAKSQLKHKWPIKDLEKALELKYAGAYKTLQEWIKEGIAVEVKAGSKGPPAVYKFVQRDAK